MTAHEVIDRFIAWMEKEVQAGRSAPATLASYKIYLPKLKALLPPELPADKIRPFHVIEGPDIWHFHQTSKRVFSWAERIGILDSNPLRNHRMPAIQGRERILTPEEITALLNASPPHLRDFLWCMLQTGARPGELRDMTWKDVNLEGRYALVHGYKGKKRRKKECAARTIIFTKDMVEALTAWKRARSPLPTDHVFLSSFGKPYGKTGVNNAYRKAVKLAGINQTGERSVPYTLRHTMATMLTVNGIGQRTLADLMGHSRMSTTERYQHLNVSHLIDAFDKVTDSQTPQSH